MRVAKRAAGFTIVELLIVIVVIAILASVVVVAYSKVSQKANNTQTITAVKEWAKILQQYIVANGYPTYDISSGNGGYEQYPCVGTGYPGGVCASTTNVNAVGPGVSYVSTAFLNEMKAVTSSLPTPSFQTVYFSGAPHVGGFINLHVSGAGSVSIGYFLKGGSDVQCPNIGIGSSAENGRSSDGVYCYVSTIQ
jgi:prepilin-type N-terminal cleavage/methylation domain-containing protein